MRVRSLDDAAAFVDDAGVALVFPNGDLVLPSLWEAIAGTSEVTWATRDESGGFVSFSPEFGSIWRWKDELPARRLACAGQHLARQGALVSPRLVAAMYALTGRRGEPDDFRQEELSPLQREVAEAVLAHGPCTRPEIRMLLGTSEKRKVDAAVEALQRRLVLTHAGVVSQEQSWPAVTFDVLARRWRARLRTLPPPEEARRALASGVLRAAGEASAADLAAALGWRRKQAAEVLEELGDRGAAIAHDEDGIAVWAAT